MPKTVRKKRQVVIEVVIESRSSVGGRSLPLDKPNECAKMHHFAGLTQR